jgi:hypothetical protein
MFTCPDKDIHSIYLDNELPEKYIKEYEAHIRDCSKCRAELESMRRIREMFTSDAKSVAFDSHMLDQSFERLQSRLKYSRIISDRHIYPLSIVKWTVPAAAAAAILAIVVPVRIGKPSPVAGSFLAISRQKPVPITQNKVVVSGNIPHTVLSSLFKGKAHKETGNIPVLTAQFTNFGASAETDEKNISEALTCIDIFRPEFNDQETIRITFPHMSTIPLNSDMQIPLMRSENQNR